MALKLYFSRRSPPCQTVVLVGQCLGVNFDLIPTAPMQGDTFKPEYLKMNPAHLIPTLVEKDGYTIWESRTIARYLSQKYGKDDRLYPNELRKRTKVDVMLDFDIGTLYRNLMQYTTSIFLTGKPDEDIKPLLDDSLLVLERCLEKSETGWVAAEQFTIADITLFMSVNTLILTDYDLEQFPLIRKWLPAVKSSIPNYDVVGRKAEADFKEFHEELKTRN